MINDLGFQRFAGALKQKHGLDLALYKEAQILRRLQSYMLRHSIDGWDGLRAYITSEDKVSHLVDYLDINVSEFFRNPELFKYLEEKVFRPAAAKQHKLHVWSAGCSIGAEPYSLAISLAETRVPLGGRIWATDLDDGALRHAQQGLFTAGDIKNVSEGLRQRYFEPEQTAYRVTPLLKTMIDFTRHDLLRDPIRTKFSLIVCRNVAIYFTEEAKLAMLKRFSEALLPGGMLFTGATESYPSHRDFGLQRLHSCFYEKVGD